MKHFFSRIFLGSFLMLGVACVSNPKPVLTPLEIQSIQSRDFESKKKIVFPSVVSVFQDLGYTIKSADIETGFITAESAAKSDSASKFWLGISNVSQTISTAFIEEIGKFTKVRLNFVATNNRSFAQGQSDRDDTPVLDAQIYQNAFERIENAIFVRSGN